MFQLRAEGDMAETIYRGFHLLTRWLAYAGVVSLFLAMGVTIIDIVLRTAARAVNLVAGSIGVEPVGWAIPGVVELVQLFVMGVAFAVLPFAFMQSSHVSVDLITGRLAARKQSFLRAVAAVIAVWFLGLVFLHGWEQMLNQIDYGDVSMTLAIPYSWFWTPLLVGVAMSIAATVMLTLGNLVFAATGRGGDLLAPQHGLPVE